MRKTVLLLWFCLHFLANLAPAFELACPSSQGADFGWPGPPAHAAQGGPGGLGFAKKGGFGMVLLTFRANCAPAQKPGGAYFAENYLVGPDSSFSKFLDKKQRLFVKKREKFLLPPAVNPLD